MRRGPKPPRRRDDARRLWTEAQVEAAVASIVAALSPGVDAADVTRRTRFAKDLGWDEWYPLSLVKPVRRRLHETLDDALVRRLRTVGDLVRYVWSKMEPVR